MKLSLPACIRLRVGLSLLAAGLLLTIAPARAAQPGGWRFDASLNVLMAGIGGDLAVRGIPVHADASFDEIVDALEFSAAGRFTATRDRWLLSAEFSYMGLGASTRLADIDLDQWLVEPSVGYRFSDILTGFAGVRYQSIDLNIAFKGPLGNSGSRTQDWYDPIVGFLLRLPLASGKLTFDGRFDVGGFGVGADLTWQAYPYLNWRFSEGCSAQLGWRWLATDYENGSGNTLFRYDVVVQGPQIGFTFSF